ncbi:zinc ABC transporter substrate-binding protein [Candidatus Gracilibacteria bacterium]|nr:zinc ABC transporter substrate-binding protein [Candidatus Gracilibacteria bacterium]
MIVVIVVIVFGIIIFNSQDKDQNQADLKVVTNIYPAYDLVSQIAKEEVQITLVNNQGVDPHDFEPTGKQIAEIEDADIFIYFDEISGWVDDVLPKLKQKDIRLVNLTDSVDLLEIGEENETEHKEEGVDEKGEKHHKSFDPHVWMDPQNMQALAKVVAIELSLLDSTNSRLYETNSQIYIQNLDLLDTSLAKNLEQCLVNKIVTSHDAFDYLGNRYNFEIFPISGIDPSEEPSPQKIIELSKIVEDARINVILFETQVSDDFAKTIANETNSSVEVLYSMESPTTSQLEEFGDYVGFMKENEKSLTVALQCNK